MTKETAQGSSAEEDGESDGVKTSRSEHGKLFQIVDHTDPLSARVLSASITPRGIKGSRHDRMGI